MLLQGLDVDDTSEGSTDENSSVSWERREPACVSRRKSLLFKESLKFDDSDEGDELFDYDDDDNVDEYSNANGNGHCFSTPPRPSRVNPRVVHSAPALSKRSARKLKFNEEVDVLPIPMRTEYSMRVRSRIWSNAEEIHENAARNSVEFASEGWDWRNVCEDDEMYVCSISGELVHPVHFEMDTDEEDKSLEDDAKVSESDTDEE